MKLFALILLILSLASLAAAQSNTNTSTAYSVSGVQQTATDVYTATVDDVKVPGGGNVLIPANGTAITITTKGCLHVPGKGGENGIVLDTPKGITLLFASGATCKATELGL
jgi:hypothetical protein